MFLKVIDQPIRTSFVEEYSWVRHTYNNKNGFEDFLQIINYFQIFIIANNTYVMIEQR